MNENNNVPKTEFKILEFKASGMTSITWFHDETKIGGTKELEIYLNRMGNDGWDVAQNLGTHHILLRRKAR